MPAPLPLTSAITTADIVMTAGSTLTVNDNTTVSLSKLSGTSGDIKRSSDGSGGTLTLDQADNTTFGGAFTSSNYLFTKDGAGTFIMDGAQTNTNTRDITVNEGAYYANGTFSNMTTADKLTVASGATLGGTLSTSGEVVLSGATSILNPGMASLNGQVVENHAGTMTLAGGIEGTAGGTFNFYMDENDGGGGLLNSRIDITGGIVTLGGAKTVNLFGLGAGLLQTGVAYTLFDADLAATRTTGWDLGWTLNGNTTGQTIGSFGFVGNELQVTFGAIPEPTTGALLLGGLLALALMRRRNGKSHMERATR